MAPLSIMILAEANLREERLRLHEIVQHTKYGSRMTVLMLPSTSMSLFVAVMHMSSLLRSYNAHTIPHTSESYTACHQSSGLCDVSM